MFSGYTGISLSVRPSVCLCVRVSIYVQNINFYQSAGGGINPLPNNKILAWSELKAFADNKIDATEKLKFVLERAENVVGKGENAGIHIYPYF